MSGETRNDFGYPIPDKLARAKEYAARARVRKQARECTCERCKQAEDEERLQSVQNILNAMYN